MTLAVLYMSLIELMLLDSSRELREARQFRARIVGQTMAENAAELAAADIITRSSLNATAEDNDGTMAGRMTKDQAGVFQITAQADVKGIEHQHSEVRVYGRVTGTDIHIDYAIHQ